MTTEQLAMMREDAAAARTNANETRLLFDESGPVVLTCVGAEILAGHVDRLCSEVERLSALEAVATKHHDICLGACGCGVCAWVKASRAGK